MSGEDLYTEAKLGRLAINLVIYRFRIYSATSQLIMGLALLSVVFSLIFLYSFLENALVANMHGLSPQ